MQARTVATSATTSSTMPVTYQIESTDDQSNGSIGENVLCGDGERQYKHESNWQDVNMVDNIDGEDSGDVVCRIYHFVHPFLLIIN